MAPRPRRRVLAPDFDAGHAVSRILAGYTRFLARCEAEEPGDPKGFLGQHAAGRAALAHVEQVMKVGAMVGGDDAAPDFGALLAEARADLAENNGNSDEETDTDDPAAGSG